jgi:hypothetical protein
MGSERILARRESLKRLVRNVRKVQVNGSGISRDCTPRASMLLACMGESSSRSDLGILLSFFELGGTYWGENANGK